MSEWVSLIIIESRPFSVKRRKFKFLRPPRQHLLGSKTKEFSGRKKMDGNVMEWKWLLSTRMCYGRWCLVVGLWTVLEKGYDVLVVLVYLFLGCGLLSFRFSWIRTVWVVTPYILEGIARQERNEKSCQSLGPASQRKSVLNPSCRVGWWNFKHASLYASDFLVATSYPLKMDKTFSEKAVCSQTNYK